MIPKIETFTTTKTVIEQMKHQKVQLNASLLNLLYEFYSFLGLDFCFILISHAAKPHSSLTTEALK